MATVNDDNVGDFTNDLASDIGPLIALFGEQMTIQYLSESTSFLDYFIFSMGPIGILTAIVSVIRLCGQTSLRAFIGRSQEGEGSIEAQLCTSTSRDVCELFTKGGVQRVLGRPSILELIYIDPDSEARTSAENKHTDGEVKLYLSRNYFEDRIASEEPRWRRVKDRSIKSSDGKITKSIAFAPNPNLSLNVGVRRQSSWVFWVIAMIGLVLQTGVVVLAGTGVWILGWNLNESKGSAQDYAPAMYITGTVLLCSGMWACAALIGQTTDEIRFKRTDRQSKHPSRLLWLQPGPQVIGDQSFDPFAYFEDTEKDPLLTWTSSSKSFFEIFEIYTMFAVLITLIGFIVQFIGLRGMKGWVSLAQLGITIIMSLLRGILRLKRLGKNDNLLGAMPDLVAGHELDWLASSIISRKQQGGFFWNITGRHVIACEDDEVEQKPINASAANEDTQEDGGRQADVTESDSNALQIKTPLEDNYLYRVRVRLAHLTGNVSFRRLEGTEYQVWEDEYVKVRAKAREVASAICTAAAYLNKDQRDKNIVLRVKALSGMRHGENPSPSDHTICVTLEPPPMFSTAGWRMDSAQLEAALGLWLWSMTSTERLSNEGDEAAISLGDKIQPARIIAGGVADEHWDAQVNIQAEMNLWLGQSAMNFREAVLVCDDSETCCLATLFRPSSQVTNSGSAGTKQISIPEYSAIDSQGGIRKDRNVQRFSGWGHIQPGLNNKLSCSSETDSKCSSRQLRIQFSELALTNTSLLDLCAQELFTALSLSLASYFQLDRTEPIEESGRILLRNNSVDVFVNAFQEAGLGSSSDAMLCVVPALRQILQPLDPTRLLSGLRASADSYREGSEWERAETVLLWACEYLLPPRDQLSTNEPSLIAIEAVQATAELYRWSLSRGLQLKNDPRARSLGKFGMNGIKRLADIYGKNFEALKTILDPYQNVVKRFEEPIIDKGLELWCEAFKTALLDKDKGEALYTLCFIEPQAIRSERTLRSALPLAVRNDWSEVVRALLEMQADANTKSSVSAVDSDNGAGGTYSYQESTESPDNQRTALSYCAELGYGHYISSLLERGAAIDEPAGPDLRPPLSYAAQNGRVDIIKMLLSSGYVNVVKKDKHGCTALRWACSYGHISVVQELCNNAGGYSIMDQGSEKAFYHATEEARVDVMQVLLDNGVDVNSTGALTTATKLGHMLVIRFLLERGANVNTGEEAPLMEAIDQGHTDIAQLLIERGADLRRGRPVDFEYDSQTTVYARPIHFAVDKGNKRIVELLIGAGADIEDQYYHFHWSGGYTPLMVALYRSQFDIARLLVAHGANPSAFAFRKMASASPLTIAVQKGSLEWVALLIEKGAQLDRDDCLVKGHESALHVAARRGELECVKLLVDNGANLEAKGGWGNTPLELSAGEAVQEYCKNNKERRMRYKACCLFFVERGASMEAVNEWTLTARYMQNILANPNEDVTGEEAQRSFEEVEESPENEVDEEMDAKSEKS